MRMPLAKHRHKVATIHEVISADGQESRGCGRPRDLGVLEAIVSCRVVLCLALNVPTRPCDRQESLGDRKTKTFNGKTTLQTTM